MRISFDEEETTMTTDQTTLAIRAQLGTRFARRVRFPMDREPPQGADMRPLSRAPRGFAAREKVVLVVSNGTYRQEVQKMSGEERSVKCKMENVKWSWG